MSLLGGVFGFAGDVYSALMGKRAADKQMDFQEEMSNTAYQRAMADMQAAGLNPMLAAHLGGASTPQGAMYNPPPLGRAITSGMSDVASAGQAAAQEERTRSETMPTERLIEKLNQEIRHISAQASQSFSAAELYAQEAAKAFQETRSAMVKAGVDEKWMELFRKGEYRVLLAEVAKAVNEQAMDEHTAGQVLRWIERAVHSIGGALGGFLGGALGGALGRGRGTGVRPGAGPGLRAPSGGRWVNPFFDPHASPNYPGPRGKY